MHNSPLHVTLVQPDLLWLDPSANREALSLLLNDHIVTTDLIVLPEMFTSGFTQYPESLLNDQCTLQWMQVQARRHNAAITGSIACEVESSNGQRHYVNRMLFVTAQGDVSFYDKCHLFSMGGEHERYQPGNIRCIVPYRGWRILLTVCYDLRFPVFCRNKGDYDVMLCVANWPKSRRHPWRTLLQARAIENQAYVIGVNRVGLDGNGLEYSGDSMAVDFFGEILADGDSAQPQILSVVLDQEALFGARRAFPVLNDADSFELL
jgi:predicted amidohydrolase